jgi:prepilin-type N-terminal cleavage/methylation domain-containing protein
MKRKRFLGKELKETRIPDGFTMIELLIAVAILSIVLALAVPAMGQYRDQQRFSGAVLEVLASMRRARAVAIESNRNVVYRVDVATRTYQAFVDDGAGANAGNNQWDADERLILSGTLPIQVSFSSAVFGLNNDPFFRFNSRGFPLDSANTLANGSIVIAGWATRRIDLIASGHTTIQ